MGVFWLIDGATLDRNFLEDGATFDAFSFTNGKLKNIGRS
jgi:hypothetical protein